MAAKKLYCFLGTASQLRYPAGIYTTNDPQKADVIVIVSTGYYHEDEVDRVGGSIAARTTLYIIGRGIADINKQPRRGQFQRVELMGHFAP